MTDTFHDTSDYASTTRYEGVTIWLPQLHRDAMAAGSRTIDGRTFVGCRLLGPAVLLAVGGVRFEACDMGPSGGDVRNMLLRPVAPEKVIGTLSFGDCLFDRCSFLAVGFTGPAAFIDHFQQVIGAAPVIPGPVQ